MIVHFRYCSTRPTLTFNSTPSKAGICKTGGCLARLESTSESSELKRPSSEQKFTISAVFISLFLFEILVYKTFCSALNDNPVIFPRIFDLHLTSSLLSLLSSPSLFSRLADSDEPTLLNCPPDRLLNWPAPLGLTPCLQLQLSLFTLTVSTLDPFSFRVLSAFSNSQRIPRRDI